MRSERALRRLSYALALAGLALISGLRGLDGWVAATDMPVLQPDTAVEVLAEDGTLLRAYTVGDGRWRLAVDPARVDPGYLAMLLAYEDQRFLRHDGVDLRAMARAGLQSLRQGRIVAGGSTLSMQVARLIEDGPTGTWAGKLRQVRLALALERTLSKDAILSLYLHHAPYGGNLEGLRAGAFAWLGREPDRLTPAEAALMVALPQAPSLRRPDRAPEVARAARDRVLDRALAAGVIDADTHRAALREPVAQLRRNFPAHVPHLADRLRVGEPGARLHRTTIDADLQAAVERLALRAMARLDPRAGLAILVAEIDTGKIRAHLGSPDFTDTARLGYVDMTRALRSPGSALKPLVYGLAFSDGLIHPETLLNDRPSSFAGYAPQNFDRIFRGPVTAREALQISLNLPVVELTQALGPARVMSALAQAGITAQVPGDAPGLAVSLGGLGMTLEGLGALYASIARGGWAVTLTTSPAAPVAPRGAIMTPVAAWHLADILAGAPRPATLPDWPLAFKTGTSYGHRDALAVGFDGAYVVAVWLGRVDGAAMPGMFGVDAAAPVLFDIFSLLGPRPAPLPSAPPGALTLANAELPARLRVFGPQPGAGADGVRLAFPPQGAALAAGGAPVLARVERGQAPFTWFANGAPVLMRSFEREAHLPLEGPGFVTLSVVDAQGRAARVEVELR